MKKFCATDKLLTATILLLLLGLNMFAQSDKPFSINESPLPQPTEPINDFAGVLDTATVQRLNQRIKDFKAKANPPIVLAVAIVKTTGDRPIFDYSLAVSRGWKIGSKLDDNPSALLFIAIEDRKYFTQVSKDLEDELPDGLVGQLQRQYLVPAFKQKDYGKGVSDTVEAYIRTIEQRTSGTFVDPEKDKNQPVVEQNRSSLSGFVCCLIILVILLFIIFSRSSNRKNGKDNDRWGGGGGFGGGGGSSWVFFPTSSGGSSSDWGSSGGGSSDWGGFGGGGDFGGGGAGGDW